MPPPSLSPGPRGRAAAPPSDLDTAFEFFGDVSPEFRAAVESAAMRAAAARARAPEEARKASAPCYNCGRIMQAAERCAGCVTGGVWYCAACHDKLEGEASALGLTASGLAS